MKKCLKRFSRTENQVLSGGQAMAEFLMMFPLIAVLFGMGCVLVATLAARTEQEERLRERMMRRKTERQHREYRRFGEKDEIRLRPLWKIGGEGGFRKDDDGEKLREKIEYGDS